MQILPNDHPPFDDIARTYRQAFASLGVDVRTLVLAAPGARPVESAEYLSIERLDRVREAAKPLRRRLTELEPGVAVCHRYRAYRLLRASGVAVPRVVTVAHEFGFFKRAQRRLERRLFARGTLFAGVSPAVQAELGKTVEEPLCLPNALDLEAFAEKSRSRAAALAELGLTEDEALCIGLVGRLVEKKAPGLAIAALRRLSERGERARLLVLGDGPLAAELEQQAGGLPVEFLGFVPDARYFLRALDVLLLTSMDVEAFGMVALEAMASRLPVVAGPAPGPQFVLGGSGYYYTRREADAVADALLRVRADLASGAIAERMKQGYERAVREFSVAALARHLDAILFRTGG